ncbi:Octanoate-[acyl-carrier-protein]-protein-N-octan oyltransferase [uncultured Candidatus Thioglobus sp.]|nr:Octanoate-[acyl-carrier-protein]-protein-N-octan oyltransferase [uncultured Candidatus Thioglobus sp.]
MSIKLLIRNHDICQYQQTYNAMVTVTKTRDKKKLDEVWFLQHQPVYTLGLNGKPHHILAATDIPVVQTDRGGQVTYHGPGQLVAYLLVDLRRKAIGIKDFIYRLEQSIINMLHHYGTHAERKKGAPGVYIDGKKIAALGIRVSKGCSYHGLAININMDLSPYAKINPCGYPDLQIIQMKDIGINDNMQQIREVLLMQLLQQLEYAEAEVQLPHVQEIA